MLELFDKTDTYIIEGVRFKSYHLYKAVLKAMKENNQSLNRLEKLYLTIFEKHKTPISTLKHLTS